MKLIIENASDCKLVRTGSESNGHDCWGKYEYSNYRYVYTITGRKENVFDSSVIIHDGKDVYYVTFKSTIDFGLEYAYKILRNRLQYKLDI